MTTMMAKSTATLLYFSCEEAAFHQSRKYILQCVIIEEE